MKLKFYKTILVVSSLCVLSSCATINAKDNKPLKFSPIDVKPISYTFFKDNDEIYKKGVIKELSFPSFSKFIEKGKYERLVYEDITDKSFIIHRRTDNNYAGSGIKYKINYSIKVSNESNYSVNSITLQPVGRYEYQQGLVGKFQLPKYDIDDMVNTLSSGAVLEWSRYGGSYIEQKNILD